MRIIKIENKCEDLNNFYSFELILDDENKYLEQKWNTFNGIENDGLSVSDDFCEQNIDEDYVVIESTNKILDNLYKNFMLLQNNILSNKNTIIHNGTSKEVCEIILNIKLPLNLYFVEIEICDHDFDCTCWRQYYQIDRGNSENMLNEINQSEYISIPICYKNCVKYDTYNDVFEQWKKGNNMFYYKLTNLDYIGTCPFYEENNMNIIKDYLKINDDEFDICAYIFDYDE